MQEKEMIHDLILESKEHLLSIEPDLLELERSAKDVSDELINRIFRAIHSIKGGFGFFGYDKVTRLSHTMENILSRIRDHGLDINSQIIDALFQGIDKLRVLIDDISNSDSVSIDQELERLSPFRSDAELKGEIYKDHQAQTSSKDLSEHHPDVSDSVLEEASKNGKHVYIITLKADIDLQKGKTDPSEILKKWEKFGTVLDFKTLTNPSSDKAVENPADKVYSVVFASVLEPDLIGYGCEVSGNQIFQVNLSKYKKESHSTIPQKNDSGTDSPSVAASKISSLNKSYDDTLRVRVNLLNNLMNLAGELVLGRNQIMQLFNRKLIDLININTTDVLTHNFEQLRKKVTDTSRSDISLLPGIIASEVERVKRVYNSILSLSLKELPGISSSLQSLDSVTSLLQENIMQTRLQPVSVVFNKFPRVVRDLSHKLGKQIELTISGQDVELDKSIIEILSDPLTHLIRNCCDHGIEAVRERIACEKSPTGNIILNAYQEGGKVIISIEDDGKGIDTERIRKSALKKNLINEQEAKSLSDHELQMLIMKPGFSTAETISDISGRGVGMDVVRSNIEKLGGTVTIESEFGKGTRFYLTLPLTLAIIPSLIVSVEGRNFAVPQVGVEELIRIRSFELTKKIERIQGAEVTRLRGKLLPLVRLADVLNLEPTFIHPETGERLPDKRARWSDRRGKLYADNQESEKDERRNGKKDRRENVQNAVKIVILKTGQHLFGLVVEKVFDSEEIVVKPLPEVLKSTQCYAGATIMGDGKVAMILDPGGIAAKADLKFTEIQKDHTIVQEKAAKATGASQNVLLFDNNTKEQFGIDLSTITRIEYINKSEIEQIGNREFVKRDGHSVSLVRIHDYLPVSPPETLPEEFYLLLPRQSANRLGIIAGSVYDILNTEINLDKKEIKGTGILGSTIINNRLVIILNINELVTEVGRRLEVTYE